MKKDKKVVRLTPTKDTLRHLYLLSGNRCAFPGCTEVMINESGQFIGEICHIEAAMPGGERFNPQMTNEDRRQFKNLMLMCHEHHVVTDDVQTYTVEKLQKMKADHEKKFSDIFEHMKTSIVDYGRTMVVRYAQNGIRLNKVLSWNLDDDELSETVSELRDVADLLSDLPVSTRQLLSIMISRSHEGPWRKWVVPIQEVENTTSLSQYQLSGHIDSLVRKEIIQAAEQNEVSGAFECELYEGKSGWNYWKDFQKFCQETGVDISEICTNLNFTVFDE